jgi:multimeric flavodoxin WrbA
MKRIVILNGSPRRNGYTKALIQSFTEGAQSAGNEVREHYIHGMGVNNCIGCDSCMRTRKGCAQKNDDMQKIYEDLTWCDVVVFASPVFWGTFTAQLKAVIDRMFAWFNLDSLPSTKRDCVLLMTARGSDYTMALDQYGVFSKYLGWNNLGTVLGRGLTDEAHTLGVSI